MAGQTPRFDLNFFGGDVEGSLGDDDQKFTGEDRLTLDLILAALEAHNHRRPRVLPPPTAIPAVAVTSGDGDLDGGTTYFYVLAFVTEDGTETTPGPENSISTPALLDIPDAPTGETTAGGTLSAGQYYYALSSLREGEESALSPIFTVTVLPADPEKAVALSLESAPDAELLQVWRQKSTDPSWTRIGTVDASGGMFTDTGSVPPSLFGDPANIPTTSSRGADNYSITITLTGDDVAAVQNSAGWRIYRSTVSGVYGAASLVHEVIERISDVDPTTPLLTAWVDDGDAPLTGSPKQSSNQLSIPAFTFESANPLPTTSGYPLNYPILDGDGVLYINRAGAWTPISGGGSGGTTRGNPFMGAWDPVYSTTPGYLPADVVIDQLTLWLAINPEAGTAPSTTASADTWAGIGTNFDFYLGADSAYAQKVTFTAAHTLAAIGLYLDNTSTDPITVTLAAGTPTGTPLATASIADPSTTPGGLVSLDLSTDIPVTTTDVYYVLVTGAGAASAVNIGDGPNYDGDITAPQEVQGAAPTYTPITGRYLAMRFYSPAVARWSVLGHLVPDGGTTGQVLTKNSSIDGDYGWV